MIAETLTAPTTSWSPAQENIVPCVLQFPWEEAPKTRNPRPWPSTSQPAPEPDVEPKGGPLTRLHHLCCHISPRLVEVTHNMTQEGAPKPFVKRFKREAYTIPLAILKAILGLAVDPVRAFREFEDAKRGLAAAQDMLKATRKNLIAPQDKVSDLLESLLRMDDLIDAVLREYRAPIEMRM